MLKTQKAGISGVKKTWESDARAFQEAFMIEGLKVTGRPKSFKDFILERPNDPYNTIATRVLTIALNENPLQNNDQFGVLVSDEDLIDGWIKLINLNTVFIPMDLPKFGDVGIFVYSDQSCTITLPTKFSGKSRAVTLPFQIRSAPIRPNGDGKTLKVSVSQGKKRLGIKIKVGEEKPTPLSWDVSSHERFRGELAIEVEAVLMQMRAEAPTYHVSPAHVREAEKDPDGQIKFPAGQKKFRYLSPENLGWLMRDEVSIFDMHLPYLTLTMEQIYAIRGLAETITALAWRRSGLAGKSLPSSLLIRTGSPLSEGGVELAVEQGVYERCHKLMLGDFSSVFSEEEESDTSRHEEVLRFINQARDLFTEATQGMEMYGYRRSFTGRTWELEPFVLSNIKLNNPGSAETEETLIARYAFQKRRLTSLRRTRPKTPGDLLSIYKLDCQKK